MLSIVYADHLLQLVLEHFIILCRPHEKHLNVLAAGTLRRSDHAVLLLLPAAAIIYCIERGTASLH